jgi:hypothetical protein
MRALLAAVLLLALLALASTFKAPVDQSRRLHDPAMLVQSEAIVVPSAHGEAVVAIRKRMKPHRNARRVLASQLKAVEAEIGIGCEEDHASDLQRDADILRAELAEHREALEELDDLQRQLILMRIELIQLSVDEMDDSL